MDVLDLSQHRNKSRAPCSRQKILRTARLVSPFCFDDVIGNRSILPRSRLGKVDKDNRQKPQFRSVKAGANLFEGFLPKAITLSNSGSPVRISLAGRVMFSKLLG